MDFWSLYINDLGPFGALLGLLAVLLGVVGAFAFQVGRWVAAVPLVVLLIATTVLTAGDPPQDGQGVVVEKHVENRLLSQEYAVYFKDRDEVTRVEVSQQEYFRVEAGQSADFTVRKYHPGSVRIIPAALAGKASLTGHSRAITLDGKTVSQKGQVVPAVLVTPLDTDLPATQFLAQVVADDSLPAWVSAGANVLGKVGYDTVTSTWVLVVQKYIQPDGRVLAARPDAAPMPWPKADWAGASVKAAAGTPMGLVVEE